MTPLFKDIDVLEPTGSRRFGGYSEIAKSETADYYSLKEHVLDRLNIGLAAIENDVKDGGREDREWKEISERLGALIRDVTLLQEKC